MWQKSPHFFKILNDTHDIDDTYLPKNIAMRMHLFVILFVNRNEKVVPLQRR